MWGGCGCALQVSFCCDFFFISCGMSGRFVVVVVWVVGFMVTIDSVVAGGAKNSWVEKERDRERKEKK